MHAHRPHRHDRASADEHRDVFERSRSVDRDAACEPFAGRSVPPVATGGEIDGPRLNGLDRPRSWSVAHWPMNGAHHERRPRHELIGDVERSLIRAKVERQRTQHRVAVAGRPSCDGVHVRQQSVTELECLHQRVEHGRTGLAESPEFPVAYRSHGNERSAATPRTGTSAGRVRGSRDRPHPGQSRRPRTTAPACDRRRNPPMSVLHHGSPEAEKLSPSAICRLSVSHVRETSPDHDAVPYRCCPANADRVRLKTRLFVVVRSLARVEPFRMEERVGVDEGRIEIALRLADVDSDAFFGFRLHGTGPIRLERLCAIRPPRVHTVRRRGLGPPGARTSLEPLG